MGKVRNGHFEANFFHGVLELLSVFSGGNRDRVCTNDFDAVTLQHTELDEFHGQVESGLAPKGGQKRIGALFHDDGFNNLCGQWLDIGGVGSSRVGHDRCRVRVGQNDAITLFTKDATSLRARVVKLAGLANDDGSRPNHQNRFEVGALRHGWLR